MKKLFLALFFFFGIHFLSYGQVNSYFQDMNFISWDEFTHISFNGITLGSIMQTKGDTTKVNGLFGKPVPYRKSDDPNYYWISFGNSDISFSFDELASGLSTLEVKNPQVAVKIGSNIIHIGDSVDKLGNVKALTGTDGNKSIEFLSKDADDEWISIEFNQSTKKITKISFKTA